MPSLHDILTAKHVALIGSSPENDLVFNDDETSGRHCQITKIEEGKYLIVDLNSATGTFVNNRKVDKEFISDTDFITVGNNIFQVRKKMTEPAVTIVSQTEPVKVTQPEPVTQTTISAPVTNVPPTRPSEPAKSYTVPPTPGDGYRQKTKITVYFLSAPEDENMCRSIDKHLSTIRFNTPLPIEIYGDFKIPPGEDVRNYQQRLFDADIVLAFISVDFLNNDECYERIKKVIANHNNHQTILLPILARNCMWKATPFANLPLLPKNQQPLNNKQFWNSEDDALTEVVNDIYKSITDFTKQSTPEKPVAPTFTMPKLQINWRQNYLWKVFWKRIAATLLDALIIGIPLYLIVYVALLRPISERAAMELNYYGGVSDDTAVQLLLYYFATVVVMIIIYAFMESSSWRGTPGKLIMKLQITDNNGNPISFGKSVLRNVIKQLISAFSNIGNGLLVLIYGVAQVISYAKTKKFFHDQLSNTVIGERLK
jgi:pSer/pThr/pTyr-binding forkhead associated (FHA) protein/uncharacterized RDD family membrane protein YckC